MKYIRIKDIAKIGRGSSPRPIDNPLYFDDENGIYSWVRISDVTSSNKYLLETREKLSDLGASFSTRLNKPTLFLSIAGSVGKPCINKVKACIHDGFIYFKASKYDINYLFWFLNNPIIYVGKGKIGTQLNLNSEIIENLFIPNINLHQQIAIANFLDHQTSKIDKEISLLEKKVELLDELKQSTIYEAVTKGINPDVKMKDSGIEWIGMIPEHWEIKRVKDISKIQKGKANEMLEEQVFSSLPCIDTNFLRKKENSITYNISGKKVVPNDILILWDGANAGELFKNSSLGYLGSTFAVFKTHINNDFFYYYLKGIEKKTRSNLTGMGIPHVNGDTLKKIPFLVPPKPIQIEIINYLNKKIIEIDNSIHLNVRKINLIKEYKQSLIYEAVTGKFNIPSEYTNDNNNEEIYDEFIKYTNMMFKSASESYEINSLEELYLLKNELNEKYEPKD